MNDSPALLQIDDLCVRYADGVNAVCGVSLHVRAGERVGLIGPNGAGKTTLMLSVMNAVRFTGRIAVEGVEVSHKTERQTRSRCGMIFQDADDHLFMPTLLDDAAFGPLNQGCDPAEARRRARKPSPRRGSPASKNDPPTICPAARSAPRPWRPCCRCR